MEGEMKPMPPPRPDAHTRQASVVIGEMLRQVTGLFDTLIALLPPARPISTLTFADAITYFVTSRPPTSATKGAILRSRVPTGIHVVQVFLNEENALILTRRGETWGRQLVATQLDQELSEAFSTHDLIIVE